MSLLGKCCCNQCCNVVFVATATNYSTESVCSGAFNKAIRVFADVPDCTNQDARSLSASSKVTRFKYARDDSTVNFWVHPDDKVLTCNGRTYWYEYADIFYRCTYPSDAPGSVTPTVRTGNPIIPVTMRTTNLLGQPCNSCEQQDNTCSVGIACIALRYGTYDYIAGRPFCGVDIRPVFGYNSIFPTAGWRVNIPDVDGKTSGTGFASLRYPQCKAAGGTGGPSQVHVTFTETPQVPPFPGCEGKVESQWSISGSLVNCPNGWTCNPTDADVRILFPQSLPPNCCFGNNVLTQYHEFVRTADLTTCGILPSQRQCVVNPC